MCGIIIKARKIHGKIKYCEAPNITGKHSSAPREKWAWSKSQRTSCAISFPSLPTYFHHRLWAQTLGHILLSIIVHILTGGSIVVCTLTSRGEAYKRLEINYCKNE